MYNEYTIVLTGMVAEKMIDKLNAAEYIVTGEIYHTPKSDENCGAGKKLHLFQGFPHVAELYPDFNQTITAKIEKISDNSFEVKEILTVEPKP